MTDPRIEKFYAEEQAWPAELALLRAILTGGGLVEEFKWRGPCYTHGGGNVAIIWGMKDAATLGFLKGVLLRDPAGILAPPGAHSRVVRSVKFRSVTEIQAQAETLAAYVAEAIALEDAGARVILPKDDFDLPAELTEAMDQDPELAEAFHALTPGRKRGYAIYFAQPKNSATRFARIAKCHDRIMLGKGFNEYLG